MDPFKETIRAETRRQFFGKAARGLGGLALADLMSGDLLGAAPGVVGGLPSLPHFAPKAKQCIYLHMMGAPPQMDLLDYKPTMKDWFDKDLPESIRQGQRLTTMTSGQSRFPIAPSVFEFSQHGEGGAWFSELLPKTASMADDIAVVRSMHTDAINHEPGITFIQTGQQVEGRPCIGAWFAYGLGSMNENLPDLRGHECRAQSPARRSAGDLGEALERGLPVPRARRRRTPNGGRSSSVSEGPRRRVVGRPPADARRSGGAEPVTPCRDRRPRDPCSHRAVRDGLPHAVLGSGDGRPVRRTGEHLGALGRGGPPAREVPERGADGAPPGGTWCALRPDLSPRLGRALDSSDRAAGTGRARRTAAPGRWCRTSRSGGCSTRRW